jgi:hypothetical protein
MTALGAANALATIPEPRLVTTFNDNDPDHKPQAIWIL